MEVRCRATWTGRVRRLTAAGTRVTTAGISQRVPERIEDYAMIGDTRTAALISRQGSVDWLCVPRFDSPSCFGALLGDERHGSWSLRPQAEVRRSSRRYRPGTLVLETEFETDSGAVRIIDCMPIADSEDDEHRVIRLVQGIRGEVAMRMSLAIRFEYARAFPFVVRQEGSVAAIAGADALTLSTRVDTRDDDYAITADFAIRAGESTGFVLTWRPSHMPVRGIGDPEDAVAATQRWWEQWSEINTYRGEWREAVLRSLLTLKALTYRPTGGVVAAPTTSLPERVGGTRNWDYRYCWLRDATLTLDAFLSAGYRAEAVAWREWLVRAVAGRPEEMQILYGPAGERWLPELVVESLPGHRGSGPVRVGNAASDQLQLDVYGELMNVMSEARRSGIPPDPVAWEIQCRLLSELERLWHEPDEGIWEVRDKRRHFTHSKVMAWVAFDRGARTVERFGLEGPAEHWRRVADEIHRTVCDEGYDPERNTFVRSFGSAALDASVLVIPLVGFLPPDDRRVAGTVDAIQRELSEGGLLRRYSTPDSGADGLPPGEGTFLPCSFWLVENLALIGRQDEARALFERLLALRNDVGLLPEEYDVDAECFVGNFPQALTHTSLVHAAATLAAHADGSSAESLR